MGEKTPGGKQNGRDAAASHLVGSTLRNVAAALNDLRVISRLHVVMHRELVRIRLRQPAFAHGYGDSGDYGVTSARAVVQIRRRSTSRTRMDVGEGAVRRILFVSCRSSWR